MACKSPSLTRVTEKSEIAKKAIEALTKQVTELNAAEEDNFKKKLEEIQDALNINDFSPISYGTNIKVEFTHEFNLDLLVPVITGAIKALSATLAASGGPISILTSSAALDSYTSLINSIAEASKSSCSAAGSATFSMNKIAPGAFAIIATRSSTLQEKETFGEESITATSFQHGIFTSVQDAVNDVKYTLVVLYASTIVKLSDAKLFYLDSVMKGKLTIAEYSVLAQQIQAEIEKNIKLIAAIEKSDKIEKSIKRIIKQDVDDFPLFKKYSTDTLHLTAIKRSAMQNELINYFEHRGLLYSSLLRDAKALSSYHLDKK